jgi:hypothetical protein
LQTGHQKDGDVTEESVAVRIKTFGRVEETAENCCDVYAHVLDAVDDQKVGVS